MSITCRNFLTVQYPKSYRVIPFLLYVCIAFQIDCIFLKDRDYLIVSCLIL